jgi:hypothetical protein
MKAILEFDLPDDARELRLALKASAYLAVLWDFDQKLRAVIKYGEDKPPEIRQAMVELREELHDALSERGINLDE